MEGSFENLGVFISSFIRVDLRFFPQGLLKDTASFLVVTMLIHSSNVAEDISGMLAVLFALF